MPAGTCPASELRRVPAVACSCTCLCSSVAQAAAPAHVCDMLLLAQAYTVGCARHLRDMAATKQSLDRLLSPVVQQSAVQQPGGGGSAASGCHEAWGGLTLTAAEHVELLLQRIERDNRLLRGQLRLMEQAWCNFLDRAQLAAAVVGSFPFLVQPVALCRALGASQVQQQQPRAQRVAAAGRG